MDMRRMKITPARGGWWIGPAEVHPWRRAAIAIGILIAVMFASQFLVRNEATAVPGYTCVSQQKTIRSYYIVTGATVGKTTWYANGCYWNDHKGVKSYSLTAANNYVNAPFTYLGVISSWLESGQVCGTWSNCTHANNHMIVKGVRVGYEYCVPFAGCVSAGTPAYRVSFDSYGNFGWRQV